MKQELNVGEIVKVKQFCFKNKAGGTGMSYQPFKQFEARDEIFEGSAEVKIVERWNDYETGERAVAEAVSDNVKEYLERNANATDKRVFIGEFDLADKRLSCGCGCVVDTEGRKWEWCETHKNEPALEGKR